jgi:hypothetical protein
MAASQVGDGGFGWRVSRFFCVGGKKLGEEVPFDPRVEAFTEICQGEFALLCFCFEGKEVCELINPPGEVRAVDLSFALGAFPTFFEVGVEVAAQVMGELAKADGLIVDTEQGDVSVALEVKNAR